MAVYYYRQQLGNAFSIGIGRHELGKIWFGKEGQSKSPLTKEEAERMADVIVEHFEKHHPVTEADEEIFGDSDEYVAKHKMLNMLCQVAQCGDDECGDDDEFEKMMAEMME